MVRVALLGPVRAQGLWYQLMLARYRCGQRAQALAAYQEARHTLIDQLGVEPGPRLRQLRRQILNADPELDLPPEAGRALLAARVASQPVWPRRCVRRHWRPWPRSHRRPASSPVREERTNS
jgi:DNA-binding SARP family transcriptional activator